MVWNIYKAKRKMAYDGTDPATRTNCPSKKQKTRQTTMKSMFASINPAPTAAAASAGTTTSLIRSSNRAAAAASAGGYPRISDANRLVLYKEGRKPLVSMEYLYTLQGKNRRRFNPIWYKEYATLEYQSIADSINCFSCRMFRSSGERWTCKD